MRKIYKLIVAVISAFTIYSCSTDVLPTTGIPSETFWNTERDAWYGLNKCYVDMPNFFSGMSDELSSDNAHSQKPWEGNFELVQKSAISAGSPYGEYNFIAIRNANNVIKYVGNCKISEELKARMVAEARFFRAMSYLKLTLYFGKVAIITEPLSYDAEYVTRNSVEEVRKFVLDELSSAASVLPVSYAGGYLNETGRVTKGAALALRARAALYFGDTVEAEKAAKAVMDLGAYSLHTYGKALDEMQKKEADEMDIFIDFDEMGVDKDKFIAGMFNYVTIWQNKGNPSPSNPEYILTHEYAANEKTYDGERGCFMLDNRFGSGLFRYGFCSYKPLQEMVDAYWSIDGKTVPTPPTVGQRQAYFQTIWDDIKADKESSAKFAAFSSDPSIANYDFIKEFRNRDSRMYASLVFPFKGWHDSGAQKPIYYMWDPDLVSKDGNYSWSGYAYRKIITLNPYAPDWIDGSTDDYPLIRYAEVLLTFAEARTANTGYDAEVRAALNLLRDRCGMPDVPNSLENPLDFIRNERRIELMAEGHRFHDIRRYGKEYAASVMTGISYAPNGYIVVDKAWNDRNMLMPIPTGSMDLNPILAKDQNPGY